MYHSLLVADETNNESISTCSWFLEKISAVVLFTTFWVLIWMKITNFNSSQQLELNWGLQVLCSVAFKRWIAKWLYIYFVGLEPVLMEFSHKWFDGEVYWKLPFLAHLSTKCSWWAIVISLCPSSVRCQLFALNDFSSKTARFWNNVTGRFFGWPSTKIAQTVLLRWTRWPPELKIEKPLNDFFSRTREDGFWNSWMTLYQNCSKNSATLNKMAARAINRNMLLTTSAKSVDRFWNNFTGMFLRWLSTKIAQTVHSIEQNGHQS